MEIRPWFAKMPPEALPQQIEVGFTQNRLLVPSLCFTFPEQLSYHLKRYLVIEAGSTGTEKPTEGSARYRLLAFPIYPVGTEKEHYDQAEQAYGINALSTKQDYPPVDAIEIVGFSQALPSPVEANARVIFPFPEAGSELLLSIANG